MINSSGKKKKKKKKNKKERNFNWQNESLVVAYLHEDPLSTISVIRPKVMHGHHIVKQPVKIIQCVKKTRTRAISQG